MRELHFGFNAYSIISPRPKSKHARLPKQLNAAAAEAEDDCVSAIRACKLSVVTNSEARASTVERLRASSSIDGDVWHGAAPAPAYEWWYFDALSHDGRDALVIIFLTNFIFSPRYNRAIIESLRPTQPAQSAASFPAVAVCLYRDGRPLYRALNEYAPDDFRADATQPSCRIGQNTFRLVESASEARYELSIETTLRRSRSLRARLEWRVREGNFFEEEKEAGMDSVHHWNMVAPRCDVSGEISLGERKSRRSVKYNFQGSGYHDHNRDARWMPATIAEWQWGRIHFPATTAVFYRYRERDEQQHSTRLYLVQNGSLAVSAPRLMASETRQHHFGLRYPRLLRLQAATGDESLRLSVRQRRVIDSSFFYLRFLSDATLETDGGRTQQATGITEHLAPRALSYRWLWWLINMRIGRNGRGAFLP